MYIARRCNRATALAARSTAEWKTWATVLADGSTPHSFKLARSRVSPNGLIVGHDERAGEIKIGDTMLDAPSEREIARQGRMKREG